MMLSCYLHCWVAMSGNMENCRVLRCWCGVARPGGGAACRQGGGSTARCGDSAALLVAAAARCSQLLHRHQSTSASPPAHSRSSRTANSLQIWVSDRRTAPQPRTPRRAETLQSCSAQRDLGRVPPHHTGQRHGGFLRQVAVARDTA